MFASQSDKKGRQSAAGKVTHSEVAGRKTVPPNNLLWQSIALNKASIQPKLEVSQPNDPYEQEADRVAERVMRMPAFSCCGQNSFTPAPRAAQHKCGACKDEEEKLQRKGANGHVNDAAVAPRIVNDALSSPGRPLSPATRAFMEPRFGHDFSHVRVHSDAVAEQSARDVHARAYTVGRDIVFGAGQSALGSTEGQRLLAHELTHVVQQSKATQTLSRKPTSAPPSWMDKYEPVHAAAQATPENRQLAAMIDSLESLTNDELTKRREVVIVAAVGPVDEAQSKSRQMLEAIEFMATRREANTLEPNYERKDPVSRRLNIRALLEEGVRATGSFKAAMARYTHTPEVKSDYEYFQADADRFKSEFRSQARLTGSRMLESSLLAIRDVLLSYGLSGVSAGLAAERQLRGADLETQAARVVEVSAKSADVDAPEKSRHRFRLAEWVEYLKKHQKKAIQLRKREDDLIESGDWDQAEGVSLKLELERKVLREGWTRAESFHPILAAYRGSTDLENVDLGTLDTDPVEKQMQAVVERLLPKIVDIAKAAEKIRRDPNFALTLPSVVALTRANMFIPEKSIRSGIVNDLVAEAGDSESTFVKVAALALAILTLIPSGGASLAIPAGIALATYSAAREWEAYKTQKTLANTGIDLAHSLSTEEPSLAGFAMSLVNLGLEMAPMVGAFQKARNIKRLVNAGEDERFIRAAVDELNTLGKAPGHSEELGEQALREVRAERSGAGAAREWQVASAEAAEEAAQAVKIGAAGAKQAAVVVEKDIKEIGSFVGVSLNTETAQFLRQRPLLRQALAENRLAAQALHHCSRVCFPPGARLTQVQEVHRHLEKVRATGEYDTYMLNDFLYRRREKLDNAISDLVNHATAEDLNGFLYKERGRLAYMGQRAEIAHELEEFAAKHRDELLGQLLARQGTERDTFFKDVIIPNLRADMPSGSMFGTRDYDLLKEALGTNQLPWGKGYGPDLILVRPPRVATLDLTRVARSRHAAEKAAQTAELQTLLGPKWQVTFEGDFFHQQGITTAKVKKQINPVLLQFGMKTK
jgi:hypothetical protein